MGRSNADKSKILSKLNRLTRSAENIQKMSAYLMQFNRNPEPIIEAWMDAMRQASEDQKRLTLIYVANEILQTCKKHHASEFRSIWKDFLPEVMSMLRGSSVVERIQRILEIWASREVYDAHYIKELTEMMAAQSKISGHELEEVDKNIIDKYKPEETLASLKQLVKLETEEDQLSEEANQLEREALLTSSTPSSSTSAHIKLSGREGRGAVSQWDRYTGQLETLCTCRVGQIKARRKLWDSLRKAEVFYTAQYEDAGVVVKAYTNYGNRISRVKSLLKERITALSAGGISLLDDDSLSPSGTEMTEPVDDDLEGRIVKMQQEEEPDNNWTDEATLSTDDQNSRIRDPECHPPPPPLVPPQQYFMQPPPLMNAPAVSTCYTPSLPPPNPYAFNIISTLTGMNALSQRNVLNPMAPPQQMQTYYQQPPPMIINTQQLDTNTDSGNQKRRSPSPIGSEPSSASTNQHTSETFNHHHHHHHQSLNSGRHSSPKSSSLSSLDHKSGVRKRSHSDTAVAPTEGQSIAVIGGGRINRPQIGNDHRDRDRDRDRSGSHYGKIQDHRYFEEKRGVHSHSSGDKKPRRGQYSSPSVVIQPLMKSISTPPPTAHHHSSSLSILEPHNNNKNEGRQEEQDAQSSDGGGATPTQDEPPEDTLLPLPLPLPMGFPPVALQAQFGGALPTTPQKVVSAQQQQSASLLGGPPTVQLTCRSQNSLLGPPPPTLGPAYLPVASTVVTSSTIRPVTSSGGWAAWRQTFSPATIRASPLPSLHTIPLKTLPLLDSNVASRDHREENSSHTTPPGNRLFRSPNQFHGGQHSTRHPSFRARLPFFPNQSKTFRPRDPRHHFFK